MRMAPIDVAFAIDPGGELAALESRSLEIERAFESQRFAPPRNAEHDHRLGEIALREVAPPNGRRFSRDYSDRLRADRQNIRRRHFLAPRGGGTEGGGHSQRSGVQDPSPLPRALAVVQVVQVESQA